MRRFIVTIVGIAMAGLFAGCAPAYVETRPGYAHPAYSNRREYREEHRDRHEAREHERREWRAPEDGD